MWWEVISSNGFILRGHKTKRLGTAALSQDALKLDFDHWEGWNLPVSETHITPQKTHGSLFGKSNRCLTCRMNSLSIFFRLTGADSHIPIFSSQFHAGLVNCICFAQVVFVIWLQCDTFLSNHSVINSGLTLSGLTLAMWRTFLPDSCWRKQLALCGQRIKCVVQVAGPQNSNNP